MNLKNYKYLRMCNASMLKSEKKLLKGIRYKLKFDQGGNFETFVLKSDFKKAYLKMLIDWNILYGNIFEQELAKRLWVYVK